MVHTRPAKLEAASARPPGLPLTRCDARQLTAAWCGFGLAAYRRMMRLRSGLPAGPYLARVQGRVPRGSPHSERPGSFHRARRLQAGLSGRPASRKSARLRTRMVHTRPAKLEAASARPPGLSITRCDARQLTATWRGFGLPRSLPPHDAAARGLASRPALTSRECKGGACHAARHTRSGPGSAFRPAYIARCDARLPPRQLTAVRGSFRLASRPARISQECKAACMSHTRPAKLEAA